ncbi:DUF2269 domain-containing protein [Streptomyces sp. TRM64462]|uniref:DUF2269 domain-containing protein n=1 Tax=Streptomyces sp. TRM64462 TaxID=2741726 RepID=UPI00158638FC|nr:DUF2269 domain-containing protein [Streptomyces sp. TRM64462]
MKPLKRPVRRALLVFHVAVSVSWLGLSLGLLALGVTAYTTADTSLTEAAYRAMKVFADWLLLPIALATLVSGLVLSLGTPWGLARHRWVWTKFWLTLATATATVFALRPEIAHAAGAGVPDSSLVAAPLVSTSAYLFMTVVSVLKPWGLTRRGRRLRKQGHPAAGARRSR